MAAPRLNLARSAATQVAPSEYVEFYLGNMYAWKESGVARVLDYLMNCNVQRAHYGFDQEVGWFVVRCLRSDTRYIQTKFVDIQNEIEREIRSLQTTQTAETFEFFDHQDVKMPTYLPHAQAMSSVAVASDAVTSIDGAIGPNIIPLDVPDSLREFPLVVAWQDLQAKDVEFDDDFISLPALRQIEKAYKVGIVADNVQKVMLIGGSDAEALNLTKVSLSTLLQDYQTPRESATHMRHIFFVSQAVHGKWGVEVRKIMDANPDIRRSTILDPWHFGSYDKQMNQASCLRLCLENPFRNGHRGLLWSQRGPFPKSLLETQEPRNTSDLYKHLKVPRRLRVAPQTDEGATGVKNWLEEVSELHQALPDAETIECRETINPMKGLGDDDPIPFNFEDARVGQAGRCDEDEPIALDFEQFARRNPQAINHPRARTAKDCQITDILDRDDPILQDPLSALQRPMLPSRREIFVAHPDSLSKNSFQSYTSQELDTAQGTELERLVSSIQNILRRMSARYGDVKLFAVVGRFFADQVPTSGLATNPTDTPARGWEADEVREKLNAQEFFFIQALSCYGNDVDFLANMKIKGTNVAMWKPHSEDMFFDFRFKVMRDDECQFELVLEVNTKDYSWNIRYWEMDEGSTFVHCLDQNWDFKVRVSHDRTLEFRDGWGCFAKALIDSLEVSSPKLEYQCLFDTDAFAISRDMAIHVSNARVRQVRRFKHHDGKTYLDLARVSPTKPTRSGSRKPKCIEVATSAPGTTEAGDFGSWYEASISSVHLEQVLRENSTLVPGDKAGWSAEDLTKEVRDLCERTADVVEQMDPVGVGCDNGFKQQGSNPVAWGGRVKYQF